MYHDAPPHASEIHLEWNQQRYNCFICMAIPAIYTRRKVGGIYRYHHHIFKGSAQLDKRCRAVKTLTASFVINQAAIERLLPNVAHDLVGSTKYPKFVVSSFLSSAASAQPGNHALGCASR